MGSLPNKPAPCARLCPGGAIVILHAFSSWLSWICPVGAVDFSAAFKRLVRVNLIRVGRIETDFRPNGPRELSPGFTLGKLLTPTMSPEGAAEAAVIDGRNPSNPPTPFSPKRSVHRTQPHAGGGRRGIRLGTTGGGGARPGWQRSRRRSPGPIPKPRRHRTHSAIESVFLL